MCSKCFRESRPNVTAQTQEKVDTFKLQSLLPQLVEQKNTESMLVEDSQNKVEEKVETVAAVITEKVEEPKPKEASKNRCYNCDRKTGIRGFICKCSFNFCNKCRLPEEHDCQFDHANIEKERLKMKLVKVEGSK